MMVVFVPGWLCRRRVVTVVHRTVRCRDPVVGVLRICARHEGARCRERELHGYRRQGDYGHQPTGNHRAELVYSSVAPLRRLWHRNHLRRNS